LKSLTFSRSPFSPIDTEASEEDNDDEEKSGIDDEVEVEVEAEALSWWGSGIGNERGLQPVRSVPTVSNDSQLEQLDHENQSLVVVYMNIPAVVALRSTLVLSTRRDELDEDVVAVVVVVVADATALSFIE
jgi:hypothetical protein